MIFSNRWGDLGVCFETICILVLDIPVVNTFIGRNPVASLEENMKVFAKKWQDIVKYAGDRGVKIGIENCPMYFSADEWPVCIEVEDRAFESSEGDVVSSILTSRNFLRQYLVL